jgi:hypothetical protein
MSNSTPRRASDAVERAARAMRQLPRAQEFKDDLPAFDLAEDDEDVAIRCAVAFKQAALAGTKTLTPHTLRLIQELGYTVRVQEGVK